MTYKQIQKILLILFPLLLLLAGCKKETSNAPIGSQLWSEEDAFVYGVMEAKPLEVLDWDSGRLEYTTGNTMAETENGYYLSYQNYLLYADKTNLNNWVPVCNKPNCTHWTNDKCHAKMISTTFIVHNNRIYIEEHTGSELYPSVAVGNILASVAPDGTDKKLAYVLEDALTLSAGSSGTALLPNCWIYMINEMDAFGKTRVRMMCVSETGVQTIVDETWQEGYPKYCSARQQCRLRGDQYFYYTAISSKELCRFQNGKIELISLSLIPEEGGCINGSTLRTFKTSTGYYDIDMVTGKKTKIADNYLNDSHAVIILSNCIVETTLLWDSLEDRKPDAEHAMAVYDGSQWWDISLPPELLKADENTYVNIIGVSSDSIFFQVCNLETYRGSKYPSQLYRIGLDEDGRQAEYCFDLQLS